MVGVARIISANALLTVDAPEGDHWKLEAFAADGVTAFKCKLVAPELFFMVAKYYAVPTDQIVGSEALLRHVYPRTYARIFASTHIEHLRVLPVGHDGLEW